MGAKLVTALLAGAFFTFFLDFFLFLGLFLNYIQAQEIDVYYNVLFADHQSLLLFFLGVAIFGYLFIFLKKVKLGVIIFILSFALVNLSLIPSVGNFLGQMVFEESNKVLQESGHTYVGKIVYKGRVFTWFFDDDLEKIVKLENQKITGE